MQDSHSSNTTNILVSALLGILTAVVAGLFQLNGTAIVFFVALGTAFIFLIAEIWLIIYGTLHYKKYINYCFYNCLSEYGKSLITSTFFTLFLLMIPILFSSLPTELLLLVAAFLGFFFSLMVISMASILFYLIPHHTKLW